jgi:hypothetical protein
MATKPPNMDDRQTSPFFGSRRPPPITGENWAGQNRGRLIGTGLGFLGVPGAGLIGRWVDRRRNNRLEDQLHGMPAPYQGAPGGVTGPGPAQTSYNQTGYIPGLPGSNMPGAPNFGFQYSPVNTPGLTDYGNPYNTSPTEGGMQSAWNQLFNPSTAPVRRVRPSGHSAGSRTVLEGAAAQDAVEGMQWGSGNADAQRLIAMMKRGTIQS